MDLTHEKEHCFEEEDDEEQEQEWSGLQHPYLIHPISPCIATEYYTRYYTLNLSADL